MNHLTISVCMPNYNHAAHLEEAVEAIVTQSVQPLELLVLDDGSGDESVSILRRLAREHAGIRLVEQSINRGVVPALMRLTDMARGDYLLFTAADDKLLPGMIERATHMLKAHPQAGLCSGLSRIIDREGRDLGLYASPLVSREPVFVPPNQIREMLDDGTEWFVISSTTVLRRDVFVEVGWHEELRSVIDGFMNRVVALRHGVCFIPEPLAAWRKLPEGYSSTIGRDVSATDAMVSNLKSLMTTEYGDLFPPGYAERWTEDLALAARLEALAYKRKGWMRGSPSESLAVRCGVGSAAAHLERLLLEVRWLKRHGRPAWPTVARKLGQLRQPGKASRCHA